MTEYIIKLPGGRLMIPSFRTYYGQTERLLTLYETPEDRDLADSLSREDENRYRAGIPSILTCGY